MSRLAHLLTDTVTYTTQTTFDSSGDPNFAASATAKARVEHGSFLALDDSGVERKATHKVITEADIPATARLWLPGDDTADANKSRLIIGRSSAATPNGALTLRELYL